MPKFNFSEYGNVAYQIKGNNACSSMVANILYNIIQVMQCVIYLYIIIVCIVHIIGIGHLDLFYLFFEVCKKYNLVA